MKRYNKHTNIYCYSGDDQSYEEKSWILTVLINIKLKSILSLQNWDWVKKAILNSIVEFQILIEEILGYSCVKKVLGLCLKNAWDISEDPLCHLDLLSTMEKNDLSKDLEEQKW